MLQRFASREGYEIESELVSSLKALKRQRYFDNVIIGVITNSDDRVPDVLASFGVNVSPLRYGTAFKAGAVSEQKFDIDFHCMSYDVGFEKPDKLIFKAAESLLAQIITIQDGKGEREALADVETWQKVYVGDEHAKDVIGAQNAGWTPILLDVDDQSTGIPRLEDYPNRSPDNLLDNNTVVRIRSIQSLARWLTEPDC